MYLSKIITMLLLLQIYSCSKRNIDESRYSIDEVVIVNFERGEEIKFLSPYRKIFYSGIVSDELQINLMGEDIKAGDKLHLTGQSNEKGEIVRLVKIKKIGTT